MADWLLGIQDWNADQGVVLRPPSLDFTLRLKQVSDISTEFALSQFTTIDPWAPKRSDWFLSRDGIDIIEGIVSRRNLSKDRDTILFGGKCYLWYLENRKYPFNYPFDFGDWPRKWTAQDLTVITESILQDMLDDEPVYTIPLIFGNSNTGVTTNYKIDAGDTQSILDHVRQFADREDGFDFRVRPDGDNLRFAMQIPDNMGDSGYSLDRGNSEVIDFDWDDEGPEATFTMGFGSGNTQKRSSTGTIYTPSLEVYRRWDKYEDFGEVRNQDHLDKLTAALAHEDRFPKKTLQCRILIDPSDFPGFYTAAGRPYSLLGQTIHAEHDFGIHFVNAEFRILEMHFTVDRAGNEYVEFALNMVNA